MSLSFHPLPAMNAAIARDARAGGLPRVLSLCLLTLSAVATPHHAKAAEPAVSNDDWRARSLATIASRRTAVLAVEVVDAQGFPVPGAQVSIQQRRSEFRWATGASQSPANSAASSAPTGVNALTVAAAETATDGALAALCASAAARGLDVRAAWQPRSTQPARGVSWADAVEWEIPNDLSAAAKAEAIRAVRTQAPFARVLLSAPDVLDAPTRQPLVALRQEALRLGGEDRGVDGLAAVVRLGSGGNSAQEWLTRLDEGAAVQGGGATLTWHLTAVLPDASSPEAARRLMDFLHVAYGHPAVTGVSWVNAHGGPPSLDEPPSASEVRKVWNQLVGNTWNTRTNLPTSIQGIASARVFRGEHDVAVEHAGTRRMAMTRVFADASVRMVVPVVPPTLSAQRGELTQFTWPSYAAGYALETAPDPLLGPWTPCETFAMRGKSGFLQAYGASSTPRYFRLRRGGTP